MRRPDKKFINHELQESLADVTSVVAQEKTFKIICSAANDGICLINEKTKQFVWVNAEFCRITGYLEKELYSLYLEDFSQKNYIVDIIEDIGKAIRQGNCFSHQIPVSAKIKKAVYCEIRGTFIVMNHRKLLLGFFKDISQKKEIEHQLEECISNLESEKKHLEQKNLALSELIEYLEITKHKIQEDIEKNIELFIIPIIKKMQLNTVLKPYADLLEKYLLELTASFGRKISQEKSRLSPREVEICGMIKSGLASKEIADLLHISSKTVDKQRRDIRKKLDISGKKINLISFLQEL